MPPIPVKPDAVSIIIPTRDNASIIRVLLDSIRNQTHATFETIVVDGESQDSTREIAAQQGAHVLRCDVPGDSRVIARNLGAEAAQGVTLLFLDTDMELTADVIGECEELMRTGADGVVFPEKTVGDGILCDVRKWERDLIQTVDFLTFPRAIRSSTFRRLGGFDSSLVGFEDLDLGATMLEHGCVVLRARSQILHHEEDLSWSKYLRKRRTYMRSSNRFLMRHGVVGAKMFSPLERLRLYAKGVGSPREFGLFLITLMLRCLEFPSSFRTRLGKVRNVSPGVRC